MKFLYYFDGIVDHKRIQRKTNYSTNRNTQFDINVVVNEFVYGDHHTVIKNLGIFKRLLSYKDNNAPIKVCSQSPGVLRMLCNILQSGSLVSSYNI